LTVLSVDSRTIKKLVAPNQKKLHTCLATSFQVFRDVGFFADPHVDGDSGIFRGKRSVLPNLPIKGQGHADFVPAGAQLTRQGLQHIDESTGALQGRPFGTHH
jgi:hypothetical protein